MSDSSSTSNGPEIKGNLTEAQKRRAIQVFQHFIGTPDTSFGAEIGRNLKLVEIAVMDSSDRSEWAVEQEGFSWNEGDGSYKPFGGKKTRDEKKKTHFSLSVKDAVARTICEIDVTRNMCNIYGTLHGGCAAYMIDPCSVSALVALGMVMGIDGTGVSQSMMIQWHKPATLGTKLKIISTTVCLDGHIRTARSELRDRVNNTLYVSATHSTINKSPPSRMKVESKL
ncbi:hypothetical protein E1B28_004882 [Marasmius oreades]|uniref:Thioesterase domain-containing protein n=1 Tax=Marasmius oreades TaxID=181124 RepID=A0A9P8ADJ7_9AGAR|nr:uncharacterized protein E1B28_004882 [Marasmius oreades]KAG7097543.1 hypothetical protein E1B28_004882 [Marasmius oreades]